MLRHFPRSCIFTGLYYQSYLEVGFHLLVAYAQVMLTGSCVAEAASAQLDIIEAS